MIEAARQFLEGKFDSSSGVLPPYIQEHIIARNYKGWSLEYIRSLEKHDFDAHLILCILKENMDREFQLMLAGAKMGVSTGGTGDPIGMLKGAKKGGGPIKQTIRKKII